MATHRILLTLLVWTNGTNAINYVNSRSLQLSNLTMQVPFADNGAEMSLFDELFTCGWDHAVIIRDHRPEDNFRLVAAALQDRFSTHIHVSMHMKSSNGSDQWLEEQLEQLYTVHRMTNVVAMTNHAGRVLRAATNVFIKHSRGPRALMVHRMQFAIFTDDLDADCLYKDLECTPFDNVFIIFLSTVTQKWTETYTLMWRKGGPRELEKVDVHQKRATSSKSCSVFPNLKFKMNGRNLKLLIKEWLSLAYKGLGQKKGQLEYNGFLVNVVQMLSVSLNFTYDLLPSAGENQSMEWSEFAALVSQSKFDMGVGIYPLSSMIHFNHTVTFPLICTNFTGCYVYSKPDSARSPLTLYQNHIYVCYICALVYTLFVLKVIYRVAPWRNSNLKPVDVKQTGCTEGHKHHYKARSRESEPRVDFQCQVSDEDINSEIRTKNSDTLFGEVNRQISETSDSNLSFYDPIFENIAVANAKDLDLNCIDLTKKTLTNSFYQVYDGLVNLFFQFIGSSMGQSSVPNPAYFSARLLVWSWCFMVLVLNALFTGNITADLVNSASELPLTTIEDLLLRADYKIFIEKDSSFKNAISSFPKGSAIYAIYLRSQQYQVENPNFNGTLDESVSKLELQNVVAFLSSPMQEHIREKYLPHLITLKNTIFETCSGFILPQNSELEMWISDQLRRMADAGIIENLRSISRNSTMALYTDGKKVDALHFNYMLVLFTYCFYGLCCSAIALVVENVLYRLRLINI